MNLGWRKIPISLRIPALGGSERYRLYSEIDLPYHISVSEWTAKRAAILGIVFSGTSVALLFATAVAMQWQHRSGGQKDWGMVLGVAFGVTFACCTVAALLSFLVSVSLITYQRFFRLRQGLPVTVTAVSEPPHRRVRHPGLIMFTGFAALIASAKFGTAALFLVGLPAALIASAVAGGARSPMKIPLRDAVLYVGISVAIVVGIVVYAMYHH